MNLFDHLNNISLYKKKWESLSDDDKKSWNNYMINRYISMKKEYIDVVNFIQKYSLDAKLLYQFYKNILPKEKTYFKYIKPIKKEYNKELVNILSNYYMCSKRESKSYLDILDKENIISILKSLGTEDKEIKKLIK